MSVHHVILFDSWPHLSALMPPARPPGRCSRGSGIDCALPSRAPPAPSISAPPSTARAAARAAPSGRRHCPRTRITATYVRGHPTSRRRCSFPTSPPPPLPPPPPLSLLLPPSPPLSLTADSDVPAGLFANLVLRRFVRECLLHQQFQIIHHSK